MRYWDSSAIVPLCLYETQSEFVRALFSQDKQMAVWWATSVECEAAIARRRRAGTLSDSATSAAQERLRRLAMGWFTVDPRIALRDRARRLVRVHTVRAADALQLAAALEWCDGKPTGMGFVSLDDRLAEAARLEGFSVLPE